MSIIDLNDLKPRQSPEDQIPQTATPPKPIDYIGISSFMQELHVLGVRHGEKWPVPLPTHLDNRPVTRRTFSPAYAALMLAWTEEERPGESREDFLGRNLAAGHLALQALEPYREGPEGLISPANQRTLIVRTGYATTPAVLVGQRVLAVMEGLYAYSTAAEGLWAVGLYTAPQVAPLPRPPA